MVKKVGGLGVKNTRPLQNAHFCSSSRKAKILTTGIHLVF